MEYTYKPPVIMMIFAAIFFGACTPVMYHLASTNNQGADIEYFIQLNVEQATLFYWVLFGFSIILTLLGVLGAIQSIFNPRKLVLGENEIVLPCDFLLRNTARINYKDIQNLEESEISGQTFLYLHTRNKKYSIIASHLPNKETYISVRNKLTLHCS